MKKKRRLSREEYERRKKQKQLETENLKALSIYKRKEAQGKQSVTLDPNMIGREVNAIHRATVRKLIERGFSPVEMKLFGEMYADYLFTEFPKWLHKQTGITEEPLNINVINREGINV